MRLWMVVPKLMCTHHLVDEHLTTHLFATIINEGEDVTEYVKHGHLETGMLIPRHDVLVEELKRRGIPHDTPLDVIEIGAVGNIDERESRRELSAACAACDWRIARRHNENT